jgi:hypothetical protein
VDCPDRRDSRLAGTQAVSSTPEADNLPTAVAVTCINREAPAGAQLRVGVPLALVR